jgi:hypothetical protein
MRFMQAANGTGLPSRGIQASPAVRARHKRASHAVEQSLPVRGYAISDRPDICPSPPLI